MTYAEIVKKLNENQHLDIVALMRLIGMRPEDQLSNGDWTGCNFSNCEMSDFTCTNAIFIDANFENCNIENVKFSGSIISRGILKAKNVSTAVFDDNQKLQIASWRQVTLPVAMDATAFLRMIEKERSHLSAYEIVQDMNNMDFGPNKYAYTMIINKAAEVSCGSDAKDYFDEFVALGGKPDPQIWDSLIHSIETYASAESAFDSMVNSGIRPTAKTINIMIELSENISSAEKWLTKKREFDIKQDRIGYNLIIKKKNSVSACLLIISEMRKMGLSPEKIDYDVALQKAKNDEQIRQVICEMEENSLWPDDKTYNRAIHGSKKFNDAKKYFYLMIDRGFISDLHTVRSFLQKKFDLFEVITALAMINSSGFSIENEVCGQLFVKYIREVYEGRRLLGMSYIEIQNNIWHIRSEGGGLFKMLKFFAETYLPDEELEEVLQLLESM